ncbi:LETM1-like protein-domain-containing protein [Linnemannia elongata]|nr:LETM1-like protein-domain-containing protein [Linnemannia elongata]
MYRSILSAPRGGSSLSIHSTPTPLLQPRYHTTVIISPHPKPHLHSHRHILSTGRRRPQHSYQSTAISSSSSPSSAVSSLAFHPSALCSFRLLRSSQAAQQLLLKPTLDKETLLARSAELARIRITKGLVVGPLTTTTASSQAVNAAHKATTAGAGVGIGSDGAAIPKKSLWVRVKKELVHYWHGTKLLGTEIKISTKLANRLLHGSKLTRREQRQLRRTSGDLLRLIPFSVFIIVPFMEFLLPVALKLFPNMLPSTFEDRFAEEEKKRKLLKMRLEMAKFLQETIIQQHPNSAPTSTTTAHVNSTATGRAEVIKEFGECFRKVRSTDADELPPTTAEMIRVARLFGDELTVDNLSRPQLLSMCRYMNLNAFGTDNFLRYQIRTSMSSIRKDDKLIMTEGVDSLTEPELQAACQSRGINTTDVSSSRLRTELAQWLELHLTYSIPATILILSRTFSYSDSYIPDRSGKVLHATLSSLPNSLLHETELLHTEQAAHTAAAAAVAADPELKLRELQQQEELIANEKAQEEEIRKLCMEQARVEKEIELLERQRIGFVKQQPTTTATTTNTTPHKSHLTTVQLLELRKALFVMTAPSPVIEERVKLEGLKEQQTQQAKVRQQEQGTFFSHDIISSSPSQQNQQDSNTATATATTAPETKVADRLLGSRVEKMISKLDEELQAYESYSQEKFKPMETNDRNELTVAEVEAALRIIKHTPDEETIRLIVQKLDIDGDGLIQLDHIFELADLVEQEEGTGGIFGEGVVVDGKRLRKIDVLKDS